MMSLAHLYPEFSNTIGGMPAGLAIDPEELERAETAGFEAGYRAGWDDALKAKTKEEEALTADFVQSLQDMSFTYHEAHTKLMSSLRPLMSKIVTSLLPDLMETGLQLQLMDEIETLIVGQTDGAIELAVAPSKRAGIESLLQDQTGIAFKISEEPSLTEGQAYLRVGQEEREINLDSALKDLNTAIAGFFQTLDHEVSHG